ncbi:MAG: mycothiol synthase [Actinobacteria bacterium]|nr:mycothiol synthase [Actinomycetota bacterium]
MFALTILDALDPETQRRAQELIDLAARHDDHPPFADAKLVQIHGAISLTGFGVLGQGEGDALLGLGVATPIDDGVWNVQEVVHPAHRTAGLRAEIAHRAIDEAWARGARRVQWWAVRADHEDDGLAAQLGLSPWRDVVKMTRSLPHPDAPALPEGTRLRAFEPGRDEDAWLSVNRRAFADHPEQHAITEADLRARMAEPWFAASDFLLAEDSAGLAGFCWVKIPGDGTGEIYVIATDPDRQGGGLGRALVLAGLARMTERGATTAGLYTDGNNDAALALYEGLGFTREHVDRAYAADR